MRARPTLLLVLVLLLGCKGRSTPRQLILEAVAAAERAAEEKDLAPIAARLSKDYAGSGDLDRAAVLDLLRLRFLQARSIHLLVRVPDVNLRGEDRAQAVVLVGMASAPIEGPAQLVSVRADVYRFELGFAREGGTWRVTSATWTPASPEDFL
jgi:hypothetical protein